MKETEKEYIAAWEKDKRNFRFSYICPEGHETQSSLAIFNNTKTQIKKGTRKQLCSKCNGGRGIKHNYTFEFHYEDILGKTGHKLIKIESGRKCIYICGNCGKEGKSYIQNLKKPDGKFCPFCQNDKNKLTHEEASKNLKNKGVEIIFNFKDRSSHIELVCECGEIFTNTYKGILRGRKCKKCKLKKFEQTCLDKFGANNPMHLMEFFEKSLENSFRRKDYEMPSGEIVPVMGYEPHCLDRLLKKVHPFLKRPLTENEIFLNESIPNFPYIDRKGTKRVYFPDILIKTENPYKKGEMYECFIEVKSTWTFNKDTETNYEKWKAVAEAGHNLKVYIYDNKKLLDIWTFFKNMEKPPRSMNKKVITFDEPIKLQKGELSQEDREYIAIEELFSKLGTDSVWENFN